MKVKFKKDYIFTQEFLNYKIGERIKLTKEEHKVLESKVRPVKSLAEQKEIILKGIRRKIGEVINFIDAEELNQDRVKKLVQDYGYTSYERSSDEKIEFISFNDIIKESDYLFSEDFGYTIIDALDIVVDIIEEMKEEESINEIIR